MERRAFLRGAGTTLLLPWLPSALPARAAVAGPARRLVYWFVPNGLMPDTIRPTIVGPNYDLSAVLEPIAALQARVTVVNGLENRSSGSETYSTHEQCTASLLTDHLVENAFSGSLDADVSVDQYAARVAGTTTPFSSLVLGTDEPSISGGSNSEIYDSTISWAGPQTPVAPIISPRGLFDRMFAGTDPLATAEEIDRRARLRTSVLDAVAERTTALSSRLDATDRAKLDQFATGVRELELRIDQLGTMECPQPAEPEEGLDFAARVTAMNDLMVLALQCDHTRFVSYMLGPSSSYTSYSFIGVTADSHTLSHGWATSASQRADLTRIQNWQVAQWTDLCTKLAAVPEDGGDLLSNTMVMLITEFGDSNLHIGHPVPMLVAGGEAGGIAQGQHRLYTNRPHVDLLAANLEFAGVASGGFGRYLTEPLDLSS
jgi:hypothetical protein